jgi:ferredoxin
MPKIILDREKCIGAFSCVAVDPEKWKQAGDNKVDLAGSKKVGAVFEREISAGELELARAAAASCPVNAIEVKE